MSIVVAYVLCIAVTVCAAGFFVFSYKLGRGSLGFTKSEVIVFLAFALAAWCFVYYMVNQNEYVYYWDYGGYWTMSYTNMQALFRDPLGTVVEVCKSVWYSDYNLILPMLIALPMRLFGYTFTRYVMINAVCFLVPVWFVLLTVVKKVAAKSGLSENRRGIVLVGISMFLLFTFSSLYGAMLHGYIDVACLLPASLSVLLFIDYDPCAFQRKDLVRDVVLSINLLATILFRRYFAYFVVGYMVAWVCWAVLQIMRRKGMTDRKAAAVASIKHLAVIGGVALTIMLVFFHKLLFRMLFTDYAGQYEAYDDLFSAKLQGAASRIGIIFLLFAGIAIIQAFAGRNHKKIVFFLAICSLVAMMAFFGVQDMGVQHIYIIAGPLFLLSVMGIYGLYTCKNAKIGIFLLIVCLLSSATSFAHTFFPAVREEMRQCSALFPRAYAPLQRSDIESLHQLADTLNELVGDSEKQVYTLASGSHLNASILDSLNKPYSGAAVKNLLVTHDVDLRDGFPAQFLEAEIVVTTNPVDLHLAPGSQEVVRFLAQEVMDEDSPIGRHFEVNEQTFSLDDGVEVLIYEKISEFTTDDLQFVADYFDAYYPGYEQLFSQRILTSQ